MEGLEQFWPKVLHRYVGEVLVYEFERDGERRRWAGEAPLVRVDGSGPIVMFEGRERRVCAWSKLLAVEGS